MHAFLSLLSILGDMRHLTCIISSTFFIMKFRGDYVGYCDRRFKHLFRNWRV